MTNLKHLFWSLFLVFCCIALPLEFMRWCAYRFRHCMCLGQARKDKGSVSGLAARVSAMQAEETNVVGVNAEVHSSHEISFKG